MIRPIASKINASWANNVRVLAKCYSTVPNKLTDDYDKLGYFVARKLISDKKLDKFIDRFKKICQENIRVPVMTVMKDVVLAKSKSDFLQGEKAITKIQDFCQDDELFAFCCLDEVIGFVKEVTGPNIMAMHTMLINKPPGNFTF